MLLVAHGGVGGTSTREERVLREAVEKGVEGFRMGRGALWAAVRTVYDLEASRILNAGLGALIRVGEVVERDAVVATLSEGEEQYKDVSLLGGVIAVRNVPFPSLLALHVAHSPHIFLVAEGAEEFARLLGLSESFRPNQRVWTRWSQTVQRLRDGRLEGLAPLWKPETLLHFRTALLSLGEYVRSRGGVTSRKRMLQALEEGRLEEFAPQWTEDALRRYGTALLQRGTAQPVDPPRSELSPRGTEGHSDTVGAVAYDGDTLAVVGSTGGAGVMLPGRMGDVTVRGAGWQIRRHNPTNNTPGVAVFATGYGEEFIKRQGTDQVVELVREGAHPQEACDEVVTRFELDAGLIAVTSNDEYGIASNRSMPSHAIVLS